MHEFEALLLGGLVKPTGEISDVQFVVNVGINEPLGFVCCIWVLLNACIHFSYLMEILLTLRVMNCTTLQLRKLYNLS